MNLTIPRLSVARSLGREEVLYVEGEEGRRSTERPGEREEEGCAAPDDLPPRCGDERLVPNAAASPPPSALLPVLSRWRRRCGGEWLEEEDDDSAPLELFPPYRRDAKMPRGERRAEDAEMSSAPPPPPLALVVVVVFGEDAEPAGLSGPGEDSEASFRWSPPRKRPPPWLCAPRNDGSSRGSCGRAGCELRGVVRESERERAKGAGEERCVQLAARRSA